MSELHERAALIDRLLGPDTSLEVRGQCAEALGTQGRWTQLTVGDRARLGQGAVAGWKEQLPCAGCARADTRLIGYADYDHRDPFYDYMVRVAEVECPACHRFSVYLYRSESRS